jgi:hypothetical protein
LGCTLLSREQEIQTEMSAMALGAPNQAAFFGQYANHAQQHQIPADIDLEGGTITSIEEVGIHAPPTKQTDFQSEEIDPNDNCKVHITRYNILSADGMEESTITKRRKLKINCTQSLKRIEYTNGKEAKFEEKTMVLGNLDMLRANGSDPNSPTSLLAIQDGNYPQVKNNSTCASHFLGSFFERCFVANARYVYGLVASKTRSTCSNVP